MCTNPGGVTHVHAHATNSHVSAAVHFLAHKMVALRLIALPKHISESELRFRDMKVINHKGQQTPYVYTDAFESVGMATKYARTPRV
jgi:hypothetical protein